MPRCDQGHAVTLVTLTNALGFSLPKKTNSSALVSREQEDVQATKLTKNTRRTKRIFVYLRALRVFVVRERYESDGC